MDIKNFKSASKYLCKSRKEVKLDKDVVAIQTIGVVR